MSGTGMNSIGSSSDSQKSVSRSDLTSFMGGSPGLEYILSSFGGDLADFMLDLIDGETLLLDATEGGLGTIFGSLP